MPVITREVTVAAGASNDNLLSGSAFEFLRSPSVVSVGIVQSAAGGFVGFTSGADLIAEEFSPPVNASGWPVVPDEFYYSDFGAPGDRLVMRARNPSGGNITFRVIVQITPTAG